MPLVLANDWQTTLAAAIADGAVTTITVTDPAPPELRGTGVFFPIRIEDEILLVTDATDVTTPFVWTVIRGVELTAPVAHTLNDTGGSPRKVDAVASAMGIKSSGVGRTSNGPNLHKFKAWTYNPESQAGDQNLASGQEYYLKMEIPEPFLISAAFCYVNTAGAGLTSGQSFIGVRKSDGTLLGKSGDQSTAWASSGEKSAAIAAEAGQSLWVFPDDLVYITLLAVFTTTSPRFIKSAATVVHNLGLVAADGYRSGVLGTGLTALPATTNPTSMTSDNKTVIVGVR